MGISKNIPKGRRQNVICASNHQGCPFGTCEGYERILQNLRKVLCEAFLRIIFKERLNRF